MDGLDDVLGLDLSYGLVILVVSAWLWTSSASLCVTRSQAGAGGVAGAHDVSEAERTLRCRFEDLRFRVHQEAIPLKTTNPTAHRRESRERSRDR